MHVPPLNLTSRIALLLASLPLLAGAGWASARTQGTAQVGAGGTVLSASAGLPQGSSTEPDAWREALARDARISFTRRSGHEAIKVLEDPASSETERSIALMALGCTEPRPVNERPRLEAFVQRGTSPERLAAILALGEFGTGADAVLTMALESAEPAERTAAMWALLRAGREASEVRVEVIAAGQSSDAPMAGRLLAFHREKQRTEAPEELREWAELRWSAGRRYGLVDGQTWKTRLLEELLEEPRFLEGVVLGSVARKPLLGVKDHLLTLLLERSSMTRLQAAALCMPEELGMLIEARLWTPGSVFGWKNILAEVDVQRMEGECLAILGQALEIPELTVTAIRLLVRAGVTDVLVGLDEQWETLSNADKVLACQAWGLAGVGPAPESMKPFAEDRDPLVRANVLITASRLGDTVAHETLRTVLADLEHPDFAVTLEAAIGQAGSPLIRSYLEQLLELLQGENQRRVAATLAVNGVSSARKILAGHLRDGFPPGEEGLHCIRALTLRDAAESVDLFIKHFPAENDLALNIGLARAIVAAQHNSSYTYLRQGLWKGSFDLSLLSAAAIVQVGGIHTLRDELNRGPLSATSMDFRRLGFALGQWGGLKEVEELKTKNGLRVNDPVLQGALLGALGRRTH